MRFLLALLFVLPLAAQEPATVTGRLLDQDDQPVVGARVEMTAMRNAPGTWKDVKVSSDARGRFRLRCAPGPDQWFLVSVEAEGLAGYKHTIRELAPGGTQDLGDLVLRPAGVVVGRIVDREGDAIDVKGWRVSARSEFLTFFARSSGVDGESGEFRIEDLPEGRVIVTARHGSLESDSVEATVEAGGEVYVELPYSGPDPSRRISARLRAPRGMYLSDVREVSVRDEAGERHVAEVDEFGFDTVFDDLEPGTYTLLVEDPRYEPIEQSVETGGQVDVQLVGAGKVKVDVVDAESGEAIPTYELKVVYPNANVSPNHAVLLPATGVHPPGTRVEGVVPGEVQLVVQVAGRPDVVQALTLEPGTELPVRFEVPPASSLSGLVLGPDGQPETLEVRIEWTPGEEYGHTGSGSWNVNGREIPKVRETVTLAPSGEFHLDGAGEGKHALRVRWSEWLVEDVVVDVPQAEPLTIQRPPSGFVTGTLRAPLGLDLSQVEVIFAPKLDRRGAMRASMMMRQTQTGAGTFGFESSGDRFRAGPLPTGTHRVSAQLTGPTSKLRAAACRTRSGRRSSRPRKS